MGELSSPPAQAAGGFRMIIVPPAQSWADFDDDSARRFDQEWISQRTDVVGVIGCRRLRVA